MNPGEVLDGRYQIISRIGAGGMGELYQATHTLLGATRAIKIIHPQISGNTDAQDRFIREARTATKVQHPNVATLHDFAALPDGAHYMVWEYIDGENLAQHLRMRGTLPPREALAIAIQALNGLDAIHRAGIVHRDISPENLMIDAAGTVKIIDLGVAKIEDAAAVSQTRTGMFVGKLRYASPEQLGFLPEGEKIDGRADLYALAMVLVELLTGRPPYEAKSPHEYFILHSRELPPRRVELPAELQGSAALQPVLEKALARNRNSRYATARELAAALEEIAASLVSFEAPSGTVAAFFDGDATLKVVTTLRTDIGRTPAPQRRAFAIAAGTLILALALIGLTMWPHNAPVVPPPDRRAAQPVIAAVSAQPSTASVTVTSDPLVVNAPEQAQLAPATSPHPPAAVAEKREEPQRQIDRRERAAAPPRQPEPEPKPKAELIAARPEVQLDTYVDGGDDGAANDRAIRHLRDQVRGVREVEVHAGAMQDALMRSLKDHMPHLSIGNSDVVIRFEGTFERLGYGRKRRAADATVVKNGRTVFRYRLPDEVFRVGMLPPDAFARVLSDAFVD